METGYHYTGCGLRNIWLKNGYAIRETKYGQGVTIHDVEGLHRAIGKALSNKPKLTGAEVRFIRKEMGLSQNGLGKLLGVTDQAVALWEKKGRLPKTADRLLRLIYVEHENGNAPIRATIERINEFEQGDFEKLVASTRKGAWHTALAA